jgi:hypothetical protein
MPMEICPGIRLPAPGTGTRERWEGSVTPTPGWGVCDPDSAVGTTGPSHTMCWNGIKPDPQPTAETYDQAGSPRPGPRPVRPLMTETGTFLVRLRVLATSWWKPGRSIVEETGCAGRTSSSRRYRAFEAFPSSAIRPPSPRPLDRTAIFPYTAFRFDSPGTGMALWSSYPRDHPFQRSHSYTKDLAHVLLPKKQAR